MTWCLFKRRDMCTFTLNAFIKYTAMYLLALTVSVVLTLLKVYFSLTLLCVKTTWRVKEKNYRSAQILKCGKLFANYRNDSSLLIWICCWKVH